jgi:putative membrane protein
VAAFLLRVAVNTAAIALAASIIPGIEVDSLVAALAAGLLLGLVNAVVRPLLVVLTLPITLFTLGLFILVLNGLCFWFVAWVVNGFRVAGFWPAVFGAVTVSAVSWAVTALVGEGTRLRVPFRRDH